MQDDDKFGMAPEDYAFFAEHMDSYYIPDKEETMGEKITFSIDEGALVLIRLAYMRGRDDQREGKDAPPVSIPYKFLKEILAEFKENGVR